MKLQVATLCVVVLMLLVFAIGTNHISYDNSNLTEEEENILAALLSSASGSNEENIAEEAAKFKQVLSEQRTSKDDRYSNEKSIASDHSVSNKKASSEVVKPEIIDKAVIQENNDFWTLMKRQVASDFAPIVALIPGPIKSNIWKMTIESKIMLLTVIYGALKPTLLTASKLLHQASLGLLQIVDVLDQHKQTSISINKRNENRFLERAEKHLMNKKAMKKEVQNEAIAVNA